jgi:glycosyltransferase involved in cell wall biosynthesis
MANFFLKSAIPKVSVMVLTYNHGNWLAECLESIVSQQTNFPFEIIVGDDASTDGITTNILRDYAQRFPDLIIPVIRDKNIGGCANLISIQSKTRGEYIASCDGDDMMLPGKLQKQSDYLDNRQDCSMVGHQTKFLLPNGKLVAGVRSIRHPINLLKMLEIGCPFVNSTKMYRRSAVHFWTTTELFVDFLWHIDHALSGLVGIIDEELGIYRVGVGVCSRPYFRALTTSLTIDAYDYALHMGVDADHVLKTKAVCRMRMAFLLLKSKQYQDFKKIMSEGSDAERRHRSIKCHLFAFLAHWPRCSFFVVNSFVTIKATLNTVLSQCKIRLIG